MCHKEEWKSRFQASQDRQQLAFFDDTMCVPDMEYYQKVERLGAEEYWSEELGVKNSARSATQGPKAHGPGLMPKGPWSRPKAHGPGPKRAPIRVII